MELLYYVSPKENFEAEGRIFIEGQNYPVFKKDDKYVKLCAENGDFAFSNRLMEEAINSWDFDKLEVEEVDVMLWEVSNNEKTWGYFTDEEKANDYKEVLNNKMQSNQFITKLVRAKDVFK